MERDQNLDAPEMAGTGTSEGLDDIAGDSAGEAGAGRGLDYSSDSSNDAVGESGGAGQGGALEDLGQQQTAADDSRYEVADRIYNHEAQGTVTHSYGEYLGHEPKPIRYEERPEFEQDIEEHRLLGNSRNSAGLHRSPRGSEPGLPGERYPLSRIST